MNEGLKDGSKPAGTHSGWTYGLQVWLAGIREQMQDAQNRTVDARRASFRRLLRNEGVEDVGGFWVDEKGSR
jgi:hypothetical protein